MVGITILTWEFRGTFASDNQGVKKDFGKMVGITISN
jgi:hypothetical protein